MELLEASSLPPLTCTCSATAVHCTRCTGMKADSNAASDASPNQIETNIIKKKEKRRTRHFNVNWNNKLTVEPFGELEKNLNQLNEEEQKPQRDAKDSPKTTCCCCKDKGPDIPNRQKYVNHKMEISGNVDLPSQDGVPLFKLHTTPSNSIRQVFAREYKIFWSKLQKRFGFSRPAGGRGDEIAANDNMPTDQDLVQARHLYESIPIIQESDLKIAKKDGERIVLGKGNNGAVLIAFYHGSKKGIPQGVALKIFFRSSIVSVRKEALLSILAAQGGYAPRVFGIVYLKKIDAYGLIGEFISKFVDSVNSAEAWTLRRLIQDEKDAPTIPAIELFRLSLRMAKGLQTIHDQNVIVSDIKTDNLLLQYNQQGAILPFYIDYGLSGFCKGKELNVKMRTAGKVKLKLETEIFMDKFPHYPPECARGELTSKAGDVFGLGRLFMRMFRPIKAIKRHPVSKQYFQAFHACMRENPRERLKLSVLQEKLSEIVAYMEHENASASASRRATPTPTPTTHDYTKTALRNRLTATTSRRR